MSGRTAASGAIEDGRRGDAEHRSPFDDLCNFTLLGPLMMTGNSASRAIRGAGAVELGCPR